MKKNYNQPQTELIEFAPEIAICQTLMAKKMISEMNDPMEKLTVLEVSLQEDSQCVIDILSRYLFETSVLETPVEQPTDSGSVQTPPVIEPTDGGNEPVVTIKTFALPINGEHKVVRTFFDATYAFEVKRCKNENY